MSGSTLRRLTRARVVALAVALALVAVVALVVAMARGAILRPALGPSDAWDRTGIDAYVGERMTVFSGHFGVHGGSPVHVRGVRVTGLPRGMRLVAVYGLDAGTTGGYNHGDPDPRLRSRLHPVTDIVWIPGENEVRAWGLCFVFEATAVGNWATTGFDISWRAGWRRGTTHFRHEFSMDVT